MAEPGTGRGKFIGRVLEPRPTNAVEDDDEDELANTPPPLTSHLSP